MPKIKDNAERVKKQKNQNRETLKGSNEIANKL